jgi:ABC-type nickel/cobalt efflux system permease component RcnA
MIIGIRRSFDMRRTRLKSMGRSLTGVAAACAALLLALTGASRADTVASLLGNFTINQFCGVTVGSQTIDVHYAVVFGQLPALRELHLADTDGNGVTSQAERDAYVGRLAPRLADDLELIVDGVRLPLRAVRWTTSLPTEQGGFSLRADLDLTAVLPAASALPAAPTTVASAGVVHAVQFSNHNYAGQLGWHEIVVEVSSTARSPATPERAVPEPAVPGPAVPGPAVFDTNAYDNSATSALTAALPALPAAGPLDERSVHFRFDDSGLPPGAIPIGPRPGTEQALRRASNAIKARAASIDQPIGMAAARSGRASGEAAWIAERTRELVESISGRQLEVRVIALALLAALFLGAVHALSPGHGKTLVGAYLIGSRGTPRHALFLAFTVTVTHTIGVFALGFATLYAARFVQPERLLPSLSLVSALLVLGMGLVLLVQRGRAAVHAWRAGRGLGTTSTRGTTPQRSAVGFQIAAPVAHRLILAPDHVTVYDGTMHSHGGGRMHSHLPPGAAGERVTWKSLLTLGISGGLVPCPSALVLLLAAIALGKTGFGMVLVLVFSLGLAITLSVVGLLFLYARTRLRRPTATVRWPLLLPVLSAALITLVGATLCVGAWQSFG